MKESIFEASEALQKMEGMKKTKSTSFHHYSWNSEVETTWISLIGWHHKTSIQYWWFYLLMYISIYFNNNKHYLFISSGLQLVLMTAGPSNVYGQRGISATTWVEKLYVSYVSVDLLNSKSSIWRDTWKINILKCTASMKQPEERY